MRPGRYHKENQDSHTAQCKAGSSGEGGPGSGPVRYQAQIRGDKRLALHPEHPYQTPSVAIVNKPPSCIGISPILSGSG